MPHVSPTRVFALAALFAAPAGAADTTEARLLAPTPPEYAAEVARLREQVETAESIGVAVARIQNRLAEFLDHGPGTLDCADAETSSLLARAPVFLAAFRDAAQSARVTGQRAQGFRDAPTVLPILDPDDLRDIEALENEVQLLVRSCLERSAWHARFLSAPMKRCEPRLSPIGGLTQRAPLASDDKRLPVAVVALGPLPVEPLGVPGNGSVLVVPGGKACQGTSCTPAPVLPAAVLGPEGSHVPEAPAGAPEVVPP